jgi:hypothetical protein
MFETTMSQLGYSEQARSSIREHLQDAGFASPEELIVLARDFMDRPEVFSNLLQVDFGFSPLVANRIRAVVMNHLSVEKEDITKPEKAPNEAAIATTNTRPRLATIPVAMTDSRDNGEQIIGNQLHSSIRKDHIFHEKPTFKQAHVNTKAKRRKQEGKDEYGLPRNYQVHYPKLSHELVEFMDFMTKPSTLSQEQPIRHATAEVYLRHAKLFLGWYIQNHDCMNTSAASIYDIIPNKEKQSADPILQFILWLRNSRSISVSYEANLLRGLIKLIKFRFSRESKADPAYGEKSFDDIPLVRELRKLHRDANKRQTLSPRSSDEDRKWLTWSEYLQVIQSVKKEVIRLVEDYDADPPTSSDVSPRKRKIATVYQYYLVLAFLACVPDRQRTFRELDLNRSFVKNVEQNIWTIKHGPDDYKTGRTYGDRPPLTLSPELVPAIDDFLDRWRPCLQPITDSLFVQPRTGKPLSQDSIYQIVARNCYKYTGKRTNPHLLRDMIVTHVRDSNASEKQLEALALYMGHSIQMQRTSYDRRTLTRKVAPAVELLENVNRFERVDLPSSEN